MGIPFIIGASQQKKKRVLDFYPFVAPADFDRTAQPVDIYDVFERYYRTNANAKFIYSFTSAINTLTLSAGTGISYRWGETIGGVDYVYDITSGTAFTAGSTKRYVIVIMNTNPNGYPGVVLPNGSVWAYFGITQDNGIYCISSSGNTYLTYIHFHSLTALSAVGPHGGYWFFNNSNLTGILHFPTDWTTTMGSTTTRQAFYGCHKITGIDFANVEVIHAGMFMNCKGLISVDFSTTKVKTFLGGEGIFANCTGLTSVNLDGVISVNSGAFSGCTNLTNVDFGSTIQTLQDGAFSGCSKMSGTLTLPDSLLTIGANCFSGCTSLTGTLTIPSGITSIGQGAFGDDNFTDIDVTANAGYEDVDNVLYEISTRTALHSVKGNTGTVTLQSNTLIIGTKSFYNNLRTGTLTIPDSVITIGASAFSNCKGFTALVLETTSSNLVTINGQAFYGCANLAGTLTIPGNVVTIGSQCFVGAKFSGDLTIPNSVTTLGQQAFEACTLLTGTLTLSTSLKTINIYTFFNCPFSGNLVIPDSVETIANSAFTTGGYHAAGTLTLGSGLKTIGNSFQNCGFTGTLAIPSLVTAIGEGAFSNNSFSAISSAASGFTVSDYVLYDETTSGQIKAHTSARGYAGTLTLKTGTTSILNSCFYNNTNRTGTVSILSTVTLIRTQAFESANALTGLAFSGTPTIATIESRAFYNCKALTGTLTLPASLGTAANSIAANAFTGSSVANRPQFTRCDSLKSTPPNAATNAFAFRDVANASVAIPLHIPTGSTSYTVAPWTNTAIFSSIINDL